MTDREREICSRIRMIREQLKWSQTDFANEMEITRARLFSIEYGYTPLRYDLGITICHRVNLSVLWLATGQGDQMPMAPFDYNSPTRSISPRALFSQVYDAHLAFGLEKIRTKENRKANEGRQKLAKLLENFNGEKPFDPETEKLIPNIETALNIFYKNQEQKLFDSITSGLKKKNMLTDTATHDNNQDMSPQLPRLLERLNRATSQSGKMSALANKLGVPLASVSRWLAGKREPSGEITLQLLKWVEQQERQK